MHTLGNLCPDDRFQIDDLGDIPFQLVIGVRRFRHEHTKTHKHSPIGKGHRYARIPDDLDEKKAVVTMNENKEKNVIDLYLIAGQSNAAGYSDSGNLSGVFKNVWFAGEVDKMRLTGRSSMTTMDSASYLKFVKAGYGIQSNKVGPEYGMAEVFNDYYGGDYPVLLLKSAAGGTALHDETDGQCGDYGNWYPPTMWKGQKADPSKAAMGVQYYNLVENLKRICAKLTEDGYTPKVRGMVWMQGERDLGRDYSYKTLLTALINDIRKDVAEVTGDKEALEMPFIIGKIATTFGSYNNPDVPSFNTMLEQVAASMKNVYTVETSDLIIVGPGEEVLGTDIYHFNAKDAETLGMRFAQKLLEHHSAK